MNEQNNEDEQSVAEEANEVCRRIRQLRADRAWSLEKLAAESGVSRSMLSQIEREMANPTLAVAMRIARAFGLALSELVETAARPPRIEVIRADDQKFLFRQDEQCSVRTLSPLHLEKNVEFYEVRLAPEGALSSAAHFQGTRELVTVGAGMIRVESGTERLSLETGDSARYPADVSHAICNVGTSEAVVFLVVVNP